MNGIDYLLDTCFIIELYNEHPEVISTISQHDISLSTCAISPISCMEVLGFCGLSEYDSQNLIILLNSLPTLAIDQNIENAVIDLRKHHKIKLPDAIILATTLVHRVALLTLDDGLMNKYQQEITT